MREVRATIVWAMAASFISAMVGESFHNGQDALGIVLLFTAGYALVMCGVYAKRAYDSRY